MNSINYRIEFIQAIERTKKYKLDVAEFIIEQYPERIITDNNREGLFNILDKHVYSEPNENLIGECLHYSYHSLNAICDYLKCEIH